MAYAQKGETVKIVFIYRLSGLFSNVGGKPITMKMEALTAFMKDQPKVKNVYLLNQNYSHSQQVACYFKEGMTRKRPDVKIVVEDLNPIGQVKDFAPYVAKIKQSGAD